LYASTEGKMGTTLENLLCQHIEDALMIDVSIYERDSSLNLDWADFPLKPGSHYQMFWFFKNTGSETSLSNIEIKVRNVNPDRITLCTGAFYLEEVSSMTYTDNSVEVKERQGFFGPGYASKQFITYFMVKKGEKIHENEELLEFTRVAEVHPMGKSVGQIRANPIESYPNDATERARAAVLLVQKDRL